VIAPPDPAKFVEAAHLARPVYICRFPSLSL
jgi:hypothetical protein